MSISRYLYIPLVILLGVFFYLAYSVSKQYAYYLVPVFMGIAFVYLAEPQINWWWWQRNPPDVPERLRQMIAQSSTFYQGLSEENQRIFRARIFMFGHNKEWKPQNWEQVPEDVKAMIASGAVTLHFGAGDAYLTEHLTNIVVYPGSFPSPNYPEDWHAAETHRADEVMLFSAKHLGLGFTRSQEYLDLSLYEFAKDYWHSQSVANDLPQGETAWATIKSISGFPQEALREYIGIPDIDTDAILTTLFFTHPAKFATAHSRLFTQLKSRFG